MKSFSLFSISSLFVPGIQVEEESLDGKHLVVACTIPFYMHFANSLSLFALEEVERRKEVESDRWEIKFFRGYHYYR